jgi:hypothetical protein
MTDLTDYLESYQSALGDGPHADDIRHCIVSSLRNPDDPMPLYRLALLAQMRDRWDLWEGAVLLASHLEHDSPQSVFHRACHRTRLGDWSAYRTLGATMHMINVDVRRLLWVAHEYDRTTDLSDKTLLIVQDGGFGDTLNFLCFIRPLATRAARVILSVPGELVEFVTHNFGDCAQVVPFDANAVYENVYHVTEYVWGWWSAAGLFEGVPLFEPLRAPHPIPRSTFDTRSRQVGICWAASDLPGNPPSPRSINDLALLEPLFSLQRIEWHSLQVGASASHAERCPQLRRPDPPLITFEDTANLIAGLDAVVSVDTAVCHLAGRLGIPTFTLLHYVADDRWGLGGTTAWYPTMRLIREHRRDDWPSAIGELAHHLQAAGDRSS